MPLGSADTLPPSRRAVFEATDIQRDPVAGGNTIVIYGSSDDLIEIEGDVPGCDEYNEHEGSFVVVGESLQTRVKVWYTSHGLWMIAASQVAEGMETLPVRIQGGATTYSVRAVIEGVKLVVKEAN